jgi:hypothetical protein
MKNLIIFLILIASSTSLAQQQFTELGVSYGYKKSAFDANNNIEQQSLTASASFYFWERIALEFAYTNALFVKKEKQPNFVTAFLRKTTQYTDVYEAGLIFVFADRKALFQPFIKGGAAYVKRRQVVQDDNNNPWEVTYSGTSPSYGVGAKFFFTERFSVRASYDIIQTPVERNTKVEDVNGRIGLTWAL